MNNSKNLVRKMFVGRNATAEAVMFSVKETKAGNEVDSADVVGSTVQVNYYVNEVPVKEATIKLKVEVEEEHPDHVESVELVDIDEDTVTAINVEERPDPVEVVTQSVEDIAETLEEAEEPTEETGSLTPDWEHAESLETSEELEAYFEPLGFNANPNHKPKTILRKAKEHFGE